MASFWKTCLPTLFALFSLSLSTNTWSVECPQYTGTTVAPEKIENLLSDLAKLPSVKDEFETTENYKTRVATALSGIASPRIVWIPVDLKHVTYDADTLRLTVKSYAIKNRNTFYYGVFGYGTPYQGKVPHSVSNIDIVGPTVETTDGKFEGKNSFGASTTITKVKRHTLALFEREGAPGEGLFFSHREADTPQKQVIAEFPNTPVEAAKLVKSSLMAAVVVTPKWPFFARGKVSYGPPTMMRPTEIDETLEVGVVDFHCALLTNSAGKVFGAITTR